MPSIKLKDAQGNVQIHENVSVIKVKDVDNNDVNFNVALSPNIVIFRDIDNNDYAIMSSKAGKSVQAPQEPARAGYIFRGWSLVSHEFILENKVSFPAVFNEPTTLYAMWEQKLTSGQAQITGLGNEVISTVLFNISDDFPTGYTEVTDDNNDVWLEIPTCYRKVLTTANGQITGKIISFTKVDDSYVPYSVFVKPNGQVMPYVRIGKYCMTESDRASSKNGTVKTYTLGAARTLAQNRGTGYQLYDWQFRELFNDLAMANLRTVDINQTTIIGITNWNNNIWVDGFCHDGTKYLVAYDPSKYVDSPTSATVGYSELAYAAPTGSSQYIKKLGYDSNHPFALFPVEVGGGAGTYYPDQYYYTAGNHPVYCHVGVASANYGLFLFYGNNAWSTAASCRLCYRPI